ncbi:MAG: hypothetical protein QOD53_1188, partial [Thermoleophilaceae bacterium]|nr:hypothetical protein [Thermoleophilaceae bacterium]
LTGQHQAVRQADGTISVFDNAGSRPLPPHPDSQSRGVVLRVDDENKSVRLVRQLTHTYPPLFSRSQGSMQVLPGGGALLSWGGSNPYVTEFAADGSRTFEAHFLPAGDDTYRAYRLPWRGARPPTRPDVAAFATSAGTNVYPSWNGAADVATWEVLAGSKPASLKPVASSAWLDFETRISLRSIPRYLAVRGLDSSGAVLGTSSAIAPHVVR